jgi:hypothetical protein
VHPILDAAEHHAWFGASIPSLTGTVASGRVLLSFMLLQEGEDR